MPLTTAITILVLSRCFINFSHFGDAFCLININPALKETNKENLFFNFDNSIRNIIELKLKLSQQKSKLMDKLSMAYKKINRQLKDLL